MKDRHGTSALQGRATIKQQVNGGIASGRAVRWVRRDADVPSRHRAGFRALAGALCVAWLAMLAPFSPAVRAQEGATGWGQATNLSRSGSASQPLIVRGPGQALQAFWWDRFDGLMGAWFDGTSWLPAARTPVLYASEGGFEAKPLDAMPRIVADGSGRAHAFWVAAQGTATARTGALCHAAFDAATQTWMVSQFVSDSVVGWEAFSDASGRTHVVYVRPTETTSDPAGVYYTSLSSGDQVWSAPRIVVASIYARLLTADQVRLAGAADGAGLVIVAWYDPRDSTLQTARSSDYGISWEGPQQVPVAGAEVPLLASPTRGVILALWHVTPDGPAAGMQRTLYQQLSLDGGGTWDGPERVVPSLATPGAELALDAVPDGGLLLVAGLGSYGLALSQWSAEQTTGEEQAGWSKPLSIGLAIRNPDTGETVSLEAMRMAVTANQVAIVGAGQDGEVWAVRRPLHDLAWTWEASSPWATPERMASEGARPVLPAIAGGLDGRLHAVWAAATEDGGTVLMTTSQDGSLWAPSVQALLSATQRVENFSLVVSGEWGHLIWCDGEEGSVYYSRGSIRPESTTIAWDEVHRLPAPAQTGGIMLAPQMTVDLSGRLHVAYVVPLDEGRGVYYTRSDDRGTTWSDPLQVFDAVEEGWRRLGQTALAVDADGSLYVAWVRQSLLQGAPEGVYLASSPDGLTWSVAQPIAEGAAEEPLLGIAQHEQVHVAWHDVKTDAWQYAWSRDAGQSWSPPGDVPGMAATAGSLSLTYDRAGALHLLGVVGSPSGEKSLRYVAWSADRGEWSVASDLRLDALDGDVLGVVGTVAAELGRLDVLIGLLDATGEGTATEQIWQTSLALSPSEPLVALPPTAVPRPTATAAPSATPAVAPTAAIDSTPPDAPFPTVSIGPLKLSWPSVGGLALVALLVAVIVAGRGARSH